MKTKRAGQIEFSRLLFGMSWEDPESDRRALRIQPGETMVTITSGGCNTLTLLLEDPLHIFAIDINPCQSHLLELKRAAIRHLEYEDLHAFLGLQPSTNRLQMFNSLMSDLSEPAREYWLAHRTAIRKGVVYQGRYETFLGYFRSLLRLVHGRNRIEKLFQCRSIDEQRDYFDNVWNTVQWRMLFRLLFNKHMLAKGGLSTDYFQFDDGTSSFVESFLGRAKTALRDIPVRSNYFLAQYLLGRYTGPGAVPAYLQRERLPLIRERLNRIEVVTGDLKVWLAGHPAASIDAFSLSNICELMSLEETSNTFAQVARTARRGCRIIFRNLVVPRDVPDALKTTILLCEDTSRQLLEHDRSFAYSRVRAYVLSAQC
jgi:S-adenosylmethionine-diacylglycerol 3-amino-3-carboxypropyl transferase